MTANELADKLDLIRIELTIQAATMLRQQQAEIEKLKGIVENTIKQAFYEDDFHRLEKEIEALRLRELTDEEIEHIAQQHLTVHVQFIGAGDCTIEGEIEFARAVLKKASEK